MTTHHPRATEQQAAVAELRALAEAATSGPWVATGPDDPYMGAWDVVTDGEPGERFVVCEHAGPDAAYIAAVSPDVVLGLLDEREQWFDMAFKTHREASLELNAEIHRLEDEVEALRAKVAAVEAVARDRPKWPHTLQNWWNWFDTLREALQTPPEPQGADLTASEVENVRGQDHDRDEGWEAEK